MSKPANRALAAVATGAIALTGLTGCSSSSSVSKKDVAKEITNQITTRTRMKATDMKCDDDLKAKVGATTKCEGRVNGTKQKFTAKVDKVDGKHVNFTITPG